MNGVRADLIVAGHLKQRQRQRQAARLRLPIEQGRGAGEPRRSSWEGVVAKDSDASVNVRIDGWSL
jgi:hypothetical protein